MTKRLFIFFASVFCVTASFAVDYTLATVPNVQLSDAGRFTSNPDGILSSAAVVAIDSMCLDLRRRGIAEMVVLVLESVDENSLDMFAHNILNKWGVGEKGRDNGLIVSVVRSQRDIQFATGYGLEGVLPDAICKRIQTVYMAPKLKNGDWDGGVLSGVRAVYNVLIGNEAELAAISSGNGDSPERMEGLVGLAFMALIFFGFLFLIVWILARARRNGRGRGNGPGDSSSGPRSYDGPDAGSIIGGILGSLLGSGMGGGFGGGFGGGGSFGGGFGGGRSGGGGSRTGF